MVQCSPSFFSSFEWSLPSPYLWATAVKSILQTGHFTAASYTLSFSHFIGQINSALATASVFTVSTAFSTCFVAVSAVLPPQAANKTLAVKTAYF
jgi:hypothetical protein